MDQKIEQYQDPKLRTILYAAFDAFAKYGFKRTSMADIAEGADMSRAALYMHFKNKNDIFQSMIEAYYAQACADLQVALGRGGKLSDQLLAGFTAQTGDTFKALLDSPHGAEIIDVKSNAGAVVEAGNQALERIYVQWLTVQAEVGRVSYTDISGDPTQVAKAMMKALEGLKSDVPSYQEYAKRRETLAKVFGRALQPYEA